VKVFGPAEARFKDLSGDLSRRTFAERFKKQGSEPDGRIVALFAKLISIEIQENLK